MSILTDAKIRTVLKAPPQERKPLRDGTVTGLMLRVGPRGATWSLKYSVVGAGGLTKGGHKKRGPRLRLSLGEYPATSIAAARSLANACVDQADKGLDPAVAMETGATAQGLTICALAARFLSEYVRMKELRSLQKYKGALDVHIVPGIGTELGDLLSRENVRELVKHVMVKRPRGKGGRDRPQGGKEAARTVVGVLRKMINWGMREDLLNRKDNPVSGMEDNLPKKKKKDVVLSLEDARVAYRAAGRLGYPFGPVYQLILLTGCRPGEWGDCRVPYLDLKQALLVLPADAYKEDHVHVVPLAPEAVAILERVFASHPTKSGDYVFSGTDGRQPVAGWSKAQTRMLKACLAEAGEIPKVRWTPHDLRRTVATRIAEQLGIEGEKFVKRVLGHSDGSVTEIYNRYGYVKEMRRVLERWVKELTAEEPSKTLEERVAA